jgi:hypothetical protein
MTTVNLTNSYKEALLHVLILFTEFGIGGLSRLNVSAGFHVAQIVSPYKSAANGSKL